MVKHKNLFIIKKRDYQEPGRGNRPGSLTLAFRCRQAFGRFFYAKIRVAVFKGLGERLLTDVFLIFHIIIIDYDIIKYNVLLFDRRNRAPCYLSVR